MDHHPPPFRIGSVCTGYGGLDEAVRRVFGGELAWVSDIDPGACQIIAHRIPGVPNLGDLTTTRWEDVEPVDLFIGGYPCQPFSVAGQRKGTQDERHIWPYIANALRVLRPRVAIFENVAGHLRLGFADVLADLARLGFDAQWCLVRASEVGAPHRRERLFILATSADAEGEGWEGTRSEPAWGRPERSGVPVAADAADLGHERDGSARGRRPRPADDCVPAAHADGHALREQPVAEPRRHSTAVTELARADAPADAARLGLGHTRPAGERGMAAPAVAGGAATHADPDCGGQRPDEQDVPAGQPDAAWGRFHPAIHRWERATGRRAPRATDDRNRLSPAFVEWLMGLPAGHVTDVPGLTRTQQLRALGNGVVPQQAAAAIRLLAERAGVAV